MSIEYYHCSFMPIVCWHKNLLWWFRLSTFDFVTVHCSAPILISNKSVHAQYGNMPRPSVGSSKRRRLYRIPRGTGQQTLAVMFRSQSWARLVEVATPLNKVIHSDNIKQSSVSVVGDDNCETIGSTNSVVVLSDFVVGDGARCCCRR